MKQRMQEELLESLYAIFPTFQVAWREEEDEQEEAYRSYSLHSVYLSFLPYLGRAAATPKQFCRLAALVNAEVDKGGDSENAVATCFLEHLRQVGLTKALRPSLSAQGRLRLHA